MKIRVEKSEALNTFLIIFIFFFVLIKCNSIYLSFIFVAGRSIYTHTLDEY
jgi:hypothetical protein